MAWHSRRRTGIEIGYKFCETEERICWELPQIYTGDMAERTGGDIYIGVVGPVRTGKSTFVKRVMETLVIPHIENVYQRERARMSCPRAAPARRS